MQESSTAWHELQDLSEKPGLSRVAAACLFSLATLRVVLHPAGVCFALTERQQPGVWRWAVVGAHGHVVYEGWQPAEALARHEAEHALALEPE
jgi:hypothetical protein